MLGAEDSVKNMYPASGEPYPGRPARNSDAALSGHRTPDNWFAVASLPYIPPSCLSEYDLRYDQGLDRLVYLQMLIDEEIER